MGAGLRIPASYPSTTLRVVPLPMRSMGRIQVASALMRPAVRICGRTSGAAPGL